MAEPQEFMPTQRGTGFAVSYMPGLKFSTPFGLVRLKHALLRKGQKRGEREAEYNIRLGGVFLGEEARAYGPCGIPHPGYIVMPGFWAEKSLAYRARSFGSTAVYTVSFVAAKATPPEKDAKRSVALTATNVAAKRRRKRADFTAIPTPA
jgi:hypothetical protein